MDLDLDLESLARDLDLSDLRHHLAQDSSGDEDEDLDLESPFPTPTQVEVEATVRRVVGLPDGLSAEIDIENLDNTPWHTMCKISIYSSFI